MSMKIIPPIVVLNNVSLATNQTSAGVHTLYSDNIGLQFVWTGTPTGTFGADVCNDAVLNPDGTVSGGNWIPLSFSVATSASGSPGKGFIDLNQTGAAFVRATYTSVSGSGNCTATLTGKPV